MKDQYFHKLKAVMHFHKNNKKRESDGVIEKNTFREKTFIRVIEREKKVSSTVFGFVSFNQSKRNLSRINLIFFLGNSISYFLH